VKGETRSMRSKEEAHDYRYFPDPDLLPLEFDHAYVEALKPVCRNCRTTRRRALCRLWPVAYDASILVSEKAIADYFEEVAGARRQALGQLGDQRPARRGSTRKAKALKRRRFRRRSSAGSST
jgi:Asp-tRNA(Asn)/Glu-tRNA(Gln) amidotransferase B subunit